MKIKVVIHIMPWEIDYAQLAFVKFRRGALYMPEDVQLEFQCVLNLSEYIIDWSKSSFPKEYFINKFNAIKNIISCYNITRYDVIETKEIYGHLNLQKECISTTVDGYIYVCLDMNFNEFLLPTMCESAKQITDRFAIITSEIYKMWDYTWDKIVSDRYMNIPYTQWNDEDSFTIENNSIEYANNVELHQIDDFKFAGWFDYYTKDVWNVLFKFPSDWQGYGPWDFYCLLILDYWKRIGKPLPITQYVLKNQIVYSYNNKTFDGGFSNYYKKFIHMNDIPNQRNTIESKMNYYIEKWNSDYSKGKIL